MWVNKKRINKGTRKRQTWYYKNKKRLPYLGVISASNMITILEHTKEIMMYKLKDSILVGVRC